MLNYIHKAKIAIFNFFKKICQAFSSLYKIITAPYNFIRKIIFYIVFPAPFLYRPGGFFYRPARRQAEANRNISWLQFNADGTLTVKVSASLISEDNKFEGALFSTNNKPIFDKENFYIIIAGDGGTCFEQFNDKYTKMTDERINVVAFNPPGVGMSPGNTTNPELYQETIDIVVKSLIRQGISPERILLYGSMLSAAMMLDVAARYHHCGMRVKVFADRTYSSFDHASASILSGYGENQNIFRKFLSFLIYVPVYMFLNIFSLNHSPAKAFNSINRQHFGDAYGVNTSEDVLVPPHTSLHSAVDKELISLCPLFIGSHNNSLDNHLESRGTGTASDFFKLQQSSMTFKNRIQTS